MLCLRHSACSSLTKQLTGSVVIPFQDCQQTAGMHSRRTIARLRKELLGRRDIPSRQGDVRSIQVGSLVSGEHPHSRLKHLVVGIRTLLIAVAQQEKLVQ